MKEERIETTREREPARREEEQADSRPAKPAHRPVPGVKHVPEPDAENIMPAEDEPGTM